jgi:prepilin-type processing-associated H-X9-DG protein
MMYSADADDMFVRQVYKIPGNIVPNSGGWNAPITWREATMPYIKNGVADYGGGVRLAQGGMFDTPAKTGVRGAYTTNRIITPGYCFWNSTASQWQCDTNDAGVPTPGITPMPSVSQTALDLPAQTFLTFTVGINPDWNASGDFSEAAPWWWGGAQWPPVLTGPTSGIKWDADSNVAPHWSMPRYRYTRGMNTSFADGHAKFLQKNATNWCINMAVLGYSTDRGDNTDWMFTPGNPCAAWAR